MKSTNYYNTFIEVAEDCPTDCAAAPPTKSEKKTVANLEFEMIKSNPYKFTSDDVRFAVHALRTSISKSHLKSAREEFFSKGQPCFRASPLTKRYGWGVHSNADGKIALYGVESKKYSQLTKQKNITVHKAMRNKRK